MKTKVRFVMAGGGSLGVVYLGFLDRLLNGRERRTIEVDHCYGTSVGAIISPIVVSGRVGQMCEYLWNLEDVTDLFSSGKYKNPIVNLLFNFGLYRSMDVDLITNEFLPPDFDYSRCTTVATALPSFQDIWFTGEDIPTGMLASSSVPILFEPYLIGNKAPKCMGISSFNTMSLYTDGFFTENIPVTTLWDDRTQQLRDPDFDGVYVFLKSSTKLLPTILPQQENNTVSFKNFVKALPQNRTAVIDIDVSRTIYQNLVPDQKTLREYILLGRRIAKDLLRERGHELGFL